MIEAEREGQHEREHENENENGNEAEHKEHKQSQTTHESLQTLLHLPSSLRTLSHPNSVWDIYRSLSPRERLLLPSSTLRRVLHQVVPESDVVKKRTAIKMKKASEDELEMARVCVYDWEPRLQDVMGVLEKSIAREYEEAEVASTQTTTVVSSDGGKAPLSDYLFVFQQFSYSGYIVGLERIWKELVLVRGYEMNAKSYSLRLATLSKWLSIRVDIQRRFHADYSSLVDKRAFGSKTKIEARLKPFFPTEIANLLKGILGDLRMNQDPEKEKYRRLTMDHLFRAAKESKNDEAFDLILRTGYGVDLRYPGVSVEEIDDTLIKKKKKSTSTSKSLSSAADSSNSGDGQNAALPVLDWAQTIGDQTIRPGLTGLIGSTGKTSQQTQGQGLQSSAASGSGTSTTSASLVPFSVNALNTILDKQGVQGEIWKMLTTYDVLAHPSNMERRRVVHRLDKFGDFDSIGRFTPNPRPRGEESFNERTYEEPPITLSEALKKEEKSGEIIGFFGTKTGKIEEVVHQDETVIPASDSQDHLTRSTTTNIILSPATFSDFLSPLPSPLALAEAIESEPTRYRHSFSLPIHSPNANTYAMLINYCARYAASSTRSVGNDDLNKDLMGLGVQYFNYAAREHAERKLDFIRAWVAIRTAGFEVLPPTTTERTREQLEKELALWKKEQRAKLSSPGISLDAEMVQPLFSAFYMSAPATVKPIQPHWPRALIKIIKEVVQFQKEEGQVLFHKYWPVTDITKTTYGRRRNSHDMEERRLFDWRFHRNQLAKDINGLEQLLEKEEERLEHYESKLKGNRKV